MPRMPILTDPRRLAHYHTWILRAVQLLCFTSGAISAFLLRFDFAIPYSYHRRLWIGLALLLAAKVLAFRTLSLDRGWWQYVSVPDLLRLGAGNLAGSVLAGVTIVLWAPSGFPRSLYILDFRICS